MRHSLAAILAMCTAAVLCGCTSLDDVTAWVSAAGQEVLAAAGCRRDALGVITPPRGFVVDLGGEHLGRAAAGGAVDPLPGLAGAPGPGGPLRLRSTSPDRWSHDAGCAARRCWSDRR